jgi:aspartate kinase
VTVVVQKYGGSSVATPELIRGVADRVVATRKGGVVPVVVVSAMGRTTDQLVSLAKDVSPSPHRRELDMLMSAGERIAMALLAMAIRDRGCEAVSLTGSQAGIITTSDHNQARIVELRPTRVREAVDAGRIVIVGGFQGVSLDKEVTTLGRGGSDTTAIALAGALSAQSCDIFSDVDGVYSADPKVVPDARRIDAVSHGELLELGLRGARVLAAEAVDYARRHGIELRARGTFSEATGTLVTSAPRPGTGRAVAVTQDALVVPATLRGPRDAADELMEGLMAAGVAFRDARWQDGDGEAGRDGDRDGFAGIDLLLDPRNTPDFDARLDAWTAAAAAREGSLRARRAHGTAAVIGEGIAEQAETWRIARRCLAELGLRPYSMTSSPWGLCAELPRDRLPDVVRAWHAAFPGLSAG